MQCPHCNAKWDLSNSQSQKIIKNCPFCGESLISEEKPDTDTFGGILRSLVLERGTELYKSEKSQQLKSLLSDMAVNFQKERKTLNIAITEGIPSKLLSYDGKSDEEKRTALYNNAYFLQEDTGLNKERAIETVNYLATGLGWKVQLDVKKEESTTSETPQSSPPAASQASKSPKQLFEKYLKAIHPIINKLKNWIVKTGNFIKKNVKIILALLVVLILVGVITILSINSSNNDKESISNNIENHSESVSYTNMYVNADALNIRSQANATSMQIATVSRGSELQVDTSSLGRDWVSVKYGIYSGWVNSYFLSRTKEDALKKYNIGDTGPGGGIIFYHSPSGFNVIQADGSSKLCHYLEVSKVDLGDLAWCSQIGNWYCCNIRTKEGLGYGKINTLRIINGKHEDGKLTTGNCAALACHRYSTGSTKDGEWFLPSRVELDLLYKNLGKKVMASNTTGDSLYWSSSQGDYNYACGQRVSDGFQSSGYLKDYTHSVRAVRAF